MFALATLTVLYLAGYALTCAWNPLRSCTRCHGTGKTPNRWTGRLRPCPACAGHGVRWRLGRRLWTALHR